MSATGPWKPADLGRSTALGGARPSPSNNEPRGWRDMSHFQYAGLLRDRDSRFRARTLRRRGIDLDDPLLILFLLEEEWGWDVCWP